MQKPSIPDKYHELVRRLGSEGKSNRAIAAHLGTLGIKTTHAAVGRIRQEQREEQSAIAKEVVREQLAPTLTADVKRLERLVRNAMRRVAGRGPNARPDDDAFCRLAEQARKLIDTKLKYSGAGDEGPPLNADLSKLSEADLERVAAGDFGPLTGGRAS
jgi:triphosphoribosyl-dephospho-CoA synthetase